MDDRALIETFGKAQSLADAIAARGVELTRSAVYEWKRHGRIPSRWRALVEDIARERAAERSDQP